MNWLEAIEFCAKEGCAYVRLTNGQFSWIDESDLEIVDGFTWYATADKRKKLNYARGWRNGSGSTFNGKSWNMKHVRMHRVILGLQGKEIVDHKNKNGLDNRRSNLRRCTPAQNSYNSTQRKFVATQSKYRGVIWKPKCANTVKPWYVRGSVNGKRINLGRHATEIEAARVYDEWAKIAHGEFATLNNV